jgi:hypothetical protein
VAAIATKTAPCLTTKAGTGVSQSAVSCNLRGQDMKRRMNKEARLDRAAEAEIGRLVEQYDFGEATIRFLAGQDHDAEAGVSSMASSWE